MGSTMRMTRSTSDRSLSAGSTSRSNVPPGARASYSCCPEEGLLMLPLEGITIISLEQAVAAPFATRQLADLGARVVKIERPSVGDFARDYDETVRGMASHFVWLNRSKESLTLDLKNPHARQVIDLPLDDAHVFLQNLV